jgi:hypothetical protein
MAASKRVSLTFRHPFWLKGIDRRFAAGQYELITNEEPIEELRFPIYRRVATLTFLPADAGQASSIKMVDVDTADFAAAHERVSGHRRRGRRHQEILSLLNSLRKTSASSR